MSSGVAASGEPLVRAHDAVARLVDGIEPDQWTAPTPCTEWTVRRVVGHLVFTNLFMAARVTDGTPPERVVDPLGDDPAGAYHSSGATLRAAFDQPGVLARTYDGPLGAATGTQLRQVRIADLLAHGWDLARATGREPGLPEDLAEQALAFVGPFVGAQPRTGRFAPPQPVADDAPALDRLVAFLGRPVSPPWVPVSARSS